MKRYLFLSVILVSVASFALLGKSLAQKTPATQAETNQSAIDKFKIIPLVVLKPGETKELLLTTWCTVGATRGGGFKLAEMRNGTRLSDQYKSYSRDGVTITVPSYQEAEKFANSPTFVQLRESNTVAFVVTITASKEAKPGLFEMHLADSTCRGVCGTDFRVVVNAPQD